MSEPIVEVVVEPEETPAPTVETGDVTVIVPDTNSAENAGSTDVALIVGELAARVAALEGAVVNVAETAHAAAAVASDAIELADDAGETVAVVAEEVATPAELEAIEEDVPPGSKHWLTKSFHELLGGKDR